MTTFVQLREFAECDLEHLDEKTFRKKVREA